MTSFSRIEIFNSYLFLRNLLGLTNNKKDDSFLIGFRNTGKAIIAVNEKSLKTVLLLEKKTNSHVWTIHLHYYQLEPLAFHIRRHLDSTNNCHLDEAALAALKEILKYDF